EPNGFAIRFYDVKPTHSLFSFQRSNFVAALAHRISNFYILSSSDHFGKNFFSRDFAKPTY
ncbi:hypothetical protein, partial [Paenibacillus jiagnxiensis]|uniref:hypothetical protein n=1 Tax=Paenibacillus jiagnxiensis TaxID=3228926 RepID=UPI00339E6543